MILFMTCCPALVAFASPTAVKTIVVTTLTDTADPPFNADDECGAGTIKDLPGADGLISLREAIIAANNTKGKKTITFDPSLSGGTIVVGFNGLPLPALCGGHTRINGDLDGDDVPDIILEGAAFPVPTLPDASAVAGLSVLSSHNTINGLQVQHFPFGIRVGAGDVTTAGIVTHTTVMNNILAESKLDGIIVATGNVPGSRIAHTTFTHNLVTQNARFGIHVSANLFAFGQPTGSDTHIVHTRITDNEVIGNGALGIYLVSVGDHNILSNATIAQNIVSGTTFFGINVLGGFAGADGNTLDVRIRHNIVTDNGLVGIRVIAGQDNSSNNSVVARIKGNTLERHLWYGIAAAAGEGAVNFPTGTSTQNVLDL